MKYDFDQIIDRHGLDAIAVDPDPESPYRKDIELKHGITDHIPMWIADMNFATCPDIQGAIAKRLEHPCFGYFQIRDEYYNAVINWHKTRKGVGDITKENIGYENGVLGGVASVLKTVLPEGGKVLVHSPTYVGFTHVLDGVGYDTIHSPLVRDEKGVWRMDFEDMEARIKEHNLKIAIFCSPHNPTGRVWEREEIEKAMALFAKYDMTVISDEIWSDLILGDNKHIPTQTVSEDAKQRTVAMYAPSKTFNLAGLIGSYHICYNEEFGKKLQKVEDNTFYNSINVLSMYALMGGYSKNGEEWLNQLLLAIDANVDYACKFIAEKFKGVRVSRPQGTYMLFIDCSEFLKEHNMTTQELLKKGWEAGVDWQDGEAFFLSGAIRINLALPMAKLKEAFDRLDKYVFND